MKEKLKLWGERSTFHAIPQISYSDRKSIKVLWTVCLLASSVYCGNLLVRNVLDYLNFDVNTVVEVLRDSGSDFPTVTFCNLQLCGLSDYTIKNSLNTILQNYFNKTARVNEDDIKNADMKLLLEYIKVEYLRTADATLLNKIFNKTKTSIKNNLISCQYSSEFCYENDFEYYELNEFQRCYKFNSGTNYDGNRSQLGIRKARRYGKSYGLQMELFIGIPDDCKSPLSSSFGGQLFVHKNPNDISSESNGIQLAPGTETNIAIDRTYLSRIPSPYSDCIVNTDESAAPNDLARNTFKLGTYSQQSCLQLCYQYFLVDRYKCYDSTQPFYSDASPEPVSCKQMSSESNATLVIDRELFYSLKEDKQCLNKCPMECEFVSYDMTVSSSQFPTITYSEVLVYNENISANYDSVKSKSVFDVVQSSVLSVNVFYKSDLFTNIKEKPAMALEEFISNFGGTLG